MTQTASNDQAVPKYVSEYERVRLLYERLVEEVRYILEEKLGAADIRFADVLGRAKTVESFREKAERKAYKSPLTDTTDLAGVRVVCYYESDMASIEELITSEFTVHERVDKTGELGVDKMGYHGRSIGITLGPRYKGGRYDGITELRCEIQVRTVLQDAWALISHHLVYKEESSVPQRMKRDLNNVASLLEVAQGVFDSVREKRAKYIEDIRKKEDDVGGFLAQPIDYDTLFAYTEWKYPGLGVSTRWHPQLFGDLNLLKYRTLADIDHDVEQAKPAVDAYQKENPSWFRNGTAYITKSLGFIDPDFRRKHAWGAATKDAFKKFGHLVKEARGAEQDKSRVRGKPRR